MAYFLVPQRAVIVMRPCILEETVPKGHLTRFIWSVLESLDFQEIEARYSSVRKGTGRPPYHPRMLAALWIYGMTQGLETAAAIAEACTLRDDFRWIAGSLSPCDQTLLNFLSATKEAHPILWEQVLKAMHAAGHIDLSALAEDGTKLRANASKRSFHSADEITSIIEKLKVQIAQKIAEIVDPQQVKKHNVELRALKSKLQRAEEAMRELERRQNGGSGEDQTSETTCKPPPLSGEQYQGTGERQNLLKKFGRLDFRHDAEKNVMVCPGDQELRFVGVYATDSGRGDYRLYKRLDCTGCALKDRCTDSKGRRLKVPIEVEKTPETCPKNKDPVAVASTDQAQPDGGNQGTRGSSSPQGSLTDPEAVLMLATSERRFEPSYNADITVTRHGIIVSQFLTKEAADFNHFRRALPNVVSVLGRPKTWTGDSHYGIQVNLVLAEGAGVTLYAPPMHGRAEDSGKFRSGAFRYDLERDVLVCPAGKDLEKVGTFGHSQDRPYDLYARKECTGCELKQQCTDGRGRRVKRYHRNPLVQALEARMEQEGDEMLKFRGCTVEPVNSQLRQHGLGRFHVRGLGRCGTVLTLACIAHDLLKWKAREEACAMNAAVA